MLRIDRIETIPGATTLRLEGQVIGPWVDELRRACEGILAVTGTTLTLDVAGVSFVALDGVTLFGRLIDRGVAVVNSSPFVAEQLKVTSSCGHTAAASHRMAEGTDDER
ncbi:MAG: hypothetical protein DMD79_24795 [Candidatus Rokuibacteriota bacterium]|nr:MAG: hypothetical protein DMD79_24795 [Candidatus Rokubacteria bacterium]